MRRELHLSKLSDRDWGDMKEIGRRLNDQGIYEGDQFKIAVTAFLRWVREEDNQIFLDKAEELFPLMFQ